MEGKNLNPNKNPYIQIEYKYPTICNYPVFFVPNKHNHKCGKLVFANPETKDQFLRNEANNNVMPLNMKSNGIILNDYIPARYHWQKYNAVHFSKHLEVNKVVAKSKIAMNKFGLKTGIFIDGIGWNKDSAWRFLGI